MSVAHRFTRLFGLQSLTELKACAPLALYHCAVVYSNYRVWSWLWINLWCRFYSVFWSRFWYRSWYRFWSWVCPAFDQGSDLSVDPCSDLHSSSGFYPVLKSGLWPCFLSMFLTFEILSRVFFVILSVVYYQAIIFTSTSAYKWGKCTFFTLTTAC